MTDHTADSDTLVIRGLRVAPIASPETEILQGIDLEVGKGEVHAIMGPNGSGKTTLAYALMGHPSYKVTGGEIVWKGRDILKLSPDKRSRLGMFLAFQYPTAIPGLSVASFIRSALNAKLQGVDKTSDVDPTDPMKGGISMRDFRNKMREKMSLLQVDEGFASRYVNEGFSGGEKKRLEMLQMAVLEPEMAILDETDSGLDIDALRIVAEGVNAMLNPNLGVLLITHYQRLLNYITPGPGPRPRPGPDRQERRQGPRAAARGRGLRPDPPRGRPRPGRPRRGAARPAGTGRRRARARGGRPLVGRDRPMAIEADAPASAAFDPHVVRRDFPILDQVINGHKLVYLDSASSSQKPRAVIEAVDTYYREYNANVHRGIYTIGEKATAEYEKARARVGRFINAPDSHEVVFTRNATEAINLVAYSWGRRNINRGDAIVLTEMEHHANLVPWQLLVQERDGDLEFIPITDDGVLRLDVFEVLLRLKPKLVAFTHVSNTLGTINPVREMTEMAHAAGALVLIDGAQAVPHVPVDVQELGADFYAFSGPQDARPDGLRSALGPARAARGDAAVPRRRRDDPRGPPPPIGVQRHSVEVRGGDARGRRCDRAGRRGRLSPGPRDGRGPRARAGARRLRAGRAAAVRARDRAVRADGPGPARRRHPVQPAGHPPARRRPGARPLGDRGPGRPPLHDAAP